MRRHWLWRRGAAVLAIVFLIPLSGISLANAQKAHAATAKLVVAGAWTTGVDTEWVWTQSAVGSTQSRQAILRTSDGGQSWTNVTPPGLGVIGGSAYLADVDVLDETQAWIAHGDVSSTVLKLEFTSNAGRTWSTMGTLPKGDCTVQFVSSTEGWCTVYGAAAGSMFVTSFHTRDGGRHWALLSKNSSNSDLKGALPFECDKVLYFDTAAVGWADLFCDGGVAPIFETLDGGKTWVDRRDAAPKGAFDSGSGFVDAPVTSGTHVTVGFAAYGPTRSLVYVSNNGGRTFSPVQTPVRGHQALLDLLNATSWKVMWGHKIYVTDNAGRTWHSTTSNVDITSLYNSNGGPPRAVDFANANVGWLVGPALWRTVDGGVTWTRVTLPSLAT